MAQKFFCPKTISDIRWLEISRTLEPHALIKKLKAVDLLIYADRYILFKIKSAEELDQVLWEKGNYFHFHEALVFLYALSKDVNSFGDLPINLCEFTTKVSFDQINGISNETEAIALFLKMLSNHEIYSKYLEILEKSGITI